VLAVLASAHDPAARSLVRDWSSADAVLVSAEDLTSPGWVFQMGDAARGSLVAGGQRVPVRSLRAVVTRRPAVVAEELPWIDPADRAYVAAELNAFLVAWLSALACPVVNRPSGVSLSGPGWGPAHWERAGLSWAADFSHTVVVCGSACFGARGESEAADALALARRAGVELLEVRFSDDGVPSGASELPALDSNEVRQALLDLVLRP
jgi:hypothetical protein